MAQRRIAWLAAGIAWWASGIVAVVAQPPRSSLTIRADWFDRGNVNVSLPGQAYADKYACIWNAGAVPNQTQYDFEVPVTADYSFAALYTAASSRPVEIYLDDQKVQTGFAGVTGSWQTSHARWETQCTAHMTKGQHTLKLLCPGPCMPHICAFRFESPIQFPDDWTLSRKAAQSRLRSQSMHSSVAHWIPESPLLASLDAGVHVEIVQSHDVAEFRSAATDELLMDRQVMARCPARSPWIMRLRQIQPDGSVREDFVNLLPARLHEMLRRTRNMLDDFASMQDVAATWLQRQRAECQQLQRQLADWQATPAAAADWQRFGALYLNVFRLQQKVTLGNPLLNFETLLLVKRSVSSPQLGLPQNWQSNCVLPVTGFDDEIDRLSPVGPHGQLTTLYRPSGPYFVGDVDLHFRGDRLLFSSVGAGQKWQVFEIRTDGTQLRQVTPSLPDVHNYDACYLPDGSIIFSSTASMAAVPCVNGSCRVANLYRLEESGRIRQLCFDQEHNWCPTVLDSGRILYSAMGIHRHATQSRSSTVQHEP